MLPVRRVLIVVAVGHFAVAKGRRSPIGTDQALFLSSNKSPVVGDEVRLKGWPVAPQLIRLTYFSGKKKRRYSKFHRSHWECPG